MAFARDIKANRLTDGDLTEACMVYRRLPYHYVVASVIWSNPAFAGLGIKAPNGAEFRSFQFQLFFLKGLALQRISSLMERIKVII